MNLSPTSVTSAGGQLKQVAAMVVLSLSGPMATSLRCAIEPAREWRAESTNTGSPLTKPRTGNAIAELRRISGLTWEQLAGLLQVSRRALHFWALDKQMHPTNEQRVHRILAVLRQIDRGVSSQNRMLLLSPQEDGTMAYDLLRDGRYEEVVERLGQGRVASPPRLPPMSAAAHTKRRPPSASDLLEALQESVHKKASRRIRSQPIRKPKET